MNVDLDRHSAPSPARRRATAAVPQRLQGHVAGFLEGAQGQLIPLLEYPLGHLVESNIRQALQLARDVVIDAGVELGTPEGHQLLEGIAVHYSAQPRLTPPQHGGNFPLPQMRIRQHEVHHILMPVPHPRDGALRAPRSCVVPSRWQVIPPESFHVRMIRLGRAPVKGWVVGSEGRGETAHV